MTTKAGYGTEYGENYGSLQSTPTTPGENQMTNQATLEMNDSLILQGSTLKATMQADNVPVYVHTMPSGKLIIVQQAGDIGVAVIELEEAGKALVKEVLG